MDTLQETTEYLAENQGINAKTIWIIIGVIFAVIILILIFNYIAYCCPWLFVYEHICIFCPSFIDCVRLVNICSFTKSIAYKKWSSYRPSQIFQQQIIQSADGHVIEINRMEPIVNQNKLRPMQQL